MPDAPPLPLVFRLAGPADVPAVVALVEAAYRGEASRAGWTTEADLLDGPRTDAGAVHELLQRPTSVILLVDGAPDRPGLLACCHLEQRPPGTAYLGMFAVDPARQGGGVGRAVVAEADRRARGWGCSQLRMTVIRQRPDLIAWYRRLGFAPTGEVEPFPYGEERFGRPRRDDLEFVVLTRPLVGRPA